MAIAIRNADPDAPFTLSSLIGDAGIGANGEKLVNTLAHFYPPELEAATLKRINEKLDRELHEDQDKIGSVAKVAGAPEDSDFNAHVRGGETRASEAVIVYAYHDEAGQLWKGCFPYSELGKSSPSGHTSQRDSLADSPEAAAYEHARAKARAAAGNTDTSALEAEIAELRSKLAEGTPDPDDPAPVKDYGKAKAKDIATMLSAADRATATRVHTYELAHEQRLTVLEAAEKRIGALDKADREAEETAAAQEAEIAELRAKVAELEGGGPE